MNSHRPLRWSLTSLAVALATLLVGSQAASAATGAGVMDSSFGGDGVIAEGVGENNGRMWDIAVQPDGNVVSAGRTIRSAVNAVGVTRHRPDGTRDPSFGGGDGIVENQAGVSGNSLAHGVAIAQDGSIWMAGFAYNVGLEFLVMKLHPDGTLDSSFNGTGSVLSDFGGLNDNAWGIVLQPDGKVIVAGYGQIAGTYDFIVARYLPSGALDPTFSDNGWVATHIAGGDYAYAVTLQPDGKILASGSSGGTGMSVVRYLPDGSLDPTFAGDGIQTVLFALGASADEVQLRPDGTIILAGYGWSVANSRDEATVVQLDANGMLDSSFGTGGVVQFAPHPSGGWANDAGLDPDGALLIGGYASTSTGDAFVARMLPDGSLDQTFGAAGIRMIDVFGGSDDSLCLALDASGDVIAGLESDEGALARWGIARVTNPDRTAPSAPVIDMSGRATGIWSRTSSLATTVSGSTDAWSGIAGYSYVVDSAPTTVPDAIAESYSANQSVLPDGRWYAHARAIDAAGNAGAAVHVGPFLIDTTPPAMSSRSLRAVMRSGTLRFPASDSGAGLMRVSARFQGRDVAVRGGVIRLATLAEGRGTLAVLATDAVGNETLFQRPLLVDRTAPTVRPTRPLMFGPTTVFRAADAGSGVRQKTYRVAIPRLGRNIVSIRVTDKAGNRSVRRTVVERRLSLARPALNRGLRLSTGRDGSIAASSSWVTNAFSFIGYHDPWYARKDHGTDLVGEAQWRLQRMGYLPRGHARTGILDMPTIRAVQAYQRVRHLPVLGTVGPRTRAALDQDLLRGLSPEVH